MGWLAPPPSSVPSSDLLSCHPAILSSCHPVSPTFVPSLTFNIPLPLPLSSFYRRVEIIAFDRGVLLSRSCGGITDRQAMCGRPQVRPGGHPSKQFRISPLHHPTETKIQIAQIHKVINKTLFGRCLCFVFFIVFVFVFLHWYIHHIRDIITPWGPDKIRKCSVC